MFSTDSIPIQKGRTGLVAGVRMSLFGSNPSNVRSPIGDTVAHVCGKQALGPSVLHSYRTESDFFVLTVISDSYYRLSSGLKC
jgi:hypothetical protein